MWNGANNEQVWLSRGYMGDSEQWSNRLQLYLILILVNWKVCVDVKKYVMVLNGMESKALSQKVRHDVKNMESASWRQSTLWCQNECKYVKKYVKTSKLMESMAWR